VDEQGNRWRIPKGDVAYDQPGPLGPERVCREVCTERDLLNVHGTFYELPAENAGGFPLLRPIASHNFRIKDFATYRGLLCLSGVVRNPAADNDRIIRSTDGKCALWLGSVDDLWHFGKPRGVGGPWSETAVEANVPSDPYLMTGYDQKSLALSHASDDSVTFSIQLDFTGTGTWTRWKELTVAADETQSYEFPRELSAYWVRLVSHQRTTATAVFTYK
ncbi:MAG: hypothetical protein KDA58_11365, partial [Planctomycetaceae bacterium]|nr:hypothetical protein [Planctomycetaceae bacterium]